MYTLAQVKTSHVCNVKKYIRNLLLSGFFNLKLIKPLIVIRPQNKFFAIDAIAIFYQLYEEYNITGEKEMHSQWVWYGLYYNYYMQLFFKSPAQFKSLNAKKLVPKEVLKHAILTSSNIKWKKFYIKHSNEVLEILFVSLWLKNINMFTKWLRKYFESVHLKKHKKLFIFLTYILGNFIWNYDLFFNIRGLRVKLRGKFGKAGSIRKARKYIKRGKCSYSSKNLALAHRFITIRTATGVLGLKMEVFF